MGSWGFSNNKSWFYCLFIFMMSPILVVQPVGGVCIEEERKALMEVKASLNWTLYFSDNLLPTWVDHGRSGGECCGWERVMCDPTTGHVTHLSLSNVFLVAYEEESFRLSLNWPLNISLFLHFEELRNLDLSWNYIDNTYVSTGLEMLSSLTKLELLNLSHNHIENGIFPSSLGAFTSLRILDLSYINGWEIPNDLKDISEFEALENLEILDLTWGGYYGTFQMQGLQKVPMFNKLEILNLGSNQFNESLIKSLSSLPSLKALNLRFNTIYGSFPAKELAHLTNLEKLDLSLNSIDGTPSIQDCKSLLRLKRLESIVLADNHFNKSIISCLSFLPSLKTLDLSNSYESGSTFPLKELSKYLPDLKVLFIRGNNFNGTLPMEDAELSSLRELETLDLTQCGFQSLTLNELLKYLPNLKVLLLAGNDFNGTLPIEALSSLHNLEVLDLSSNHFVGSIPSTIQSLSSLRALSFAGNKLNGSLPEHGLCGLKNLHELNLRRNMFDGNLPGCFNVLSSLKFFDISRNQFTGKLLPSLIANLTSLEYIDFSHNKFEGLLSFNLFANHTNLKLVRFISNNDKFEVETEEPVNWIPIFQLKVLVLSNCNMNTRKGRVVPSFLRHQHELQVLDVSHNSLEGQFPNWLTKNNTMLEVLNLRNNSIGGSMISMSFYGNANTRHLDMSRNALNGTIPSEIQKQFPYIGYLNLSNNFLYGAIPSSFGNFSKLQVLDLSNNKLTGEVPTGLLKNPSSLKILKLSNNRLHGHVLSGNLRLGNDMQRLHLDSNRFTGKIGNDTSEMSTWSMLSLLDISNNFFTGKIPSWISNMSLLEELVVRNNSLGGEFPCGTAPFSFLDISQNSFSGPIPSCLNFQDVGSLHLGSNRFTGPVPNFFRHLTNVLTLDIGENSLSGRIPEFLGELSNLRILLLGKNNFRGPIPKQLCQLRNVSLIDLSSNSLSGSIPSCLQNITRPNDLVFLTKTSLPSVGINTYQYQTLLKTGSPVESYYEVIQTRDEVQFTTKSMSHPYKGKILDYMAGVDLSCNKLTGEIPQQLGMLTQIRVLNLSHNQLIGPIPMQFSNLVNTESLDLSSNTLSGNVPSELTKLHALAVFNVSYNNLSGRLPEMRGQFSTFAKESYEGNPLLCGPPLDNNCTTAPQVTDSSSDEDSDEKWYEIDMTSFYGSFAVYLLVFSAVLYINPNWRRRWLDWVEECMYRCYYFLHDFVRKLFMMFRK